MNLQLTKNFSFGCCIYDGSPNDYIDWFFLDSSPKGSLRAWGLHYNCIEGEFYSTLRRSETEEDEFGDEITPPRAFQEAMISLLPPEELAKLREKA